MKHRTQFRLVQTLVRAFRQRRPAAIALLTTGLVLTGSIATAQATATGWRFNQQSTPNQITLNGVQYTGECAAGPFYPDLSASFISQTTPPAPYTRVTIKNVTPGMATDPAPYTNREYDERRPTSETAKMDFSSSHQKRRFAVLKGKNTFEYRIKQRDRVLETGTFNAEIATSLRQEERTATWINDKVCANSAVALEVCADIRNRHARRCEDGRILQAELSPNDSEITTRIYNETGTTLSFQFNNKDYTLFPGEYATLTSRQTSSTETLRYNAKCETDDETLHLPKTGEKSRHRNKHRCKSDHDFANTESIISGKRYQFTATKNGNERKIRLEEYRRSNY
jgi:hypothetical protein